MARNIVFRSCPKIIRDTEYRSGSPDNNVVAYSRTGSMIIRICQAQSKHRRELNRLIRQARIGTSAHGQMKNFWFVRQDGRIIACAGCDWHGLTAILLHLVVEQDYKHRGIGAALVRYWMEHARAHGATTLALCAMYYHGKFFKKRGFRSCPRPLLPSSIKDYWQFTAKRHMNAAVYLQSV